MQTQILTLISLTFAHFVTSIRYTAREPESHRLHVKVIHWLNVGIVYF